MQHLAHFGSLEELLAWLWLDGGWLAGCWLAGCWLAGLGPQDLRAHAHWVVTVRSTAGYSNQIANLQERKEGSLQECRTGGLEGLQGCQLARLEDWKGFKAVNLERNPPQPGGP